MNIQTFRQDLEKHIAEDKSERRLVLPAQNEIASPEIGSLLHNFLPEQHLVLYNVALSSSGQTLTVQGNVDLLNLKGLPAEAVFYIAEEGNPQLNLTVHLPEEGWTFAQSFPEFADTILDSIRLSKPLVILASQNDHPAAPYPNLKAGINFRGVLKEDSAPLQQVNWLLTDSRPLLLSGTMQHAEDLNQPPEMVLTSSEEKTAFSFGSATLSTWVTTQSHYETYRIDSADISQPDPSIELCANLQIDVKDRQIKIPLALPLREGKYGSFLLKADADELASVSLTGLEDLNHFFDGTALADFSISHLIPAEFPLGNKVSLDYVLIGISLLEQKLTDLRFRILFEDISLNIIPALQANGPALCTLDLIGLDLRIEQPHAPTRDVITATITADLVFAEAFRLTSSIALPSTEIHSHLEKGDAVPLGKLLKPLFGELPLPLETLDIYKLDLFLHPVNRSFELSAAIMGRWPIDLGVTTLELKGVSLDVDVDGTIGGAISGRFSIAQVEAGVSAALARNLVLEGSIFRANLSALAEELLGGVTLPDEIPEVEFSDIEVALTPTTGAFSLSGKSTTDWTLGGQTLHSAVDLSLSRSVVQTNGQSTASVACHLNVSAKGPVQIADDLALKKINFDFDLTEADDWSVSGSMAGRLFDKEIDLSAAYEQTRTGKKLRLASTITSPTKLVDIAGVGSFDLSKLVLELERQQIGGEAAMGWSVVADGGLKVEHAFDFEGHLELYKKTDGAAGLIFKPTVATVSLPPGAEAWLDLSFGGLSIVRGGSEAGGGWSVEASVGTACPVFHKALPDVVRARFPEQITTRFKADSTAVTLSADRILNPIDIPLPDLCIDGQPSIPLGTLRLDASDLAIRIDKDITLSARFGLGLPEELNNIFGVKEGVTPTTPSMAFFNTFDPQKPDQTTLKLELSAGTAGIKAVPLTSPIKAVKLSQREGKVWWDIDLGDFGAATVQVPELSYDVDSSSFKASGGFEITKALRLPMTPVKALLGAFEQQATSDLLPDSLPLKDLALLDQNDNLRTDEMIALLETALPDGLPREVKDAVNVFDHYVDKLPDRLRSYLNISIPTSFFFDVAVTTGGSVRVDVGVKEGDEPVKLLYPAAQGTPPTPTLQGIELYSIAVGTLMGNTLILVQTDLRIDDFDLITLAGTLLLPDEEAFPLARSQDLQRRLIIDKFFLIIIPHARVPIPVPLFYDELGVEYWGVEGIQLQAHVKFPQPQLDLMGLGKALAGSVKFFSDRDALMDPDALGEMDVRFALGSTYLQLPEYLGDQVLGHKGADLEVKAYGTMANVLNALKTFSLNRMIQTIPIEYRVGTSTVAFGPMAAGARWLLTTPDEFRQGACRQLDLAQDQSGSFIAVLPAATGVQAGGSGEEGLVTFLRGTWAVAGVADFEAVFGLAASATMGFNTGFKITGTIAGFMDAEIAGIVSIDPPAPKTGVRVDPDAVFRLAGHSHLVILDHQIFHGDVQIVDTRFRLDGKLALFPPGLPLQANGDVEGWLDDRELYLAGAVRTTLGDLALADARALITNRRVSLEGTWLGAATALDVDTTGGRWHLHGAADVAIWNLKAHAAITIDGTGRAVVQGEADPIDIGTFQLTGSGGRPKPTFAMHLQSGLVSGIDLSGTVTLLGLQSSTKVGVTKRDFQLSAGGKIFNLFACALEVRGGSLTAGEGFRVQARLQNDFFARLDNDTSNLIKNTTNDATRQLDKAQQALTAAQNKVNQIQGSIDKCKRRIRQLKKEIEDKKRWYNKLKPWQKPINSPKLAAEVGWRTTEIAAQETAKGTHETAKSAARGALDIARGSLEGLKRSLGAAADVHSFIKRHGLDAMVDVRAASFEDRLDAVKGGRVSLATIVVFMRKAPKQYRLDFNLKKPIEGARQLAKLLLPAR